MSVVNGQPAGYRSLSSMSKACPLQTRAWHWSLCGSGVVEAIEERRIALGWKQSKEKSPAWVVKGSRA